MRKNLKAIISISALIALYGAYYWGIPALVNTPKFESFIEHQINLNTGFQSNLTNPKIKMGLLPAVWFKADEIAVINSDTTKPLVLKNPALKLQLFPLLLKKAEISVFKAQNTYLQINIDKKGQIKLGQYPLNFNQNSKFTLNKMKIDLNQYKICLLYTSPSPRDA